MPSTVLRTLATTLALLAATETAAAGNPARVVLYALVMPRAKLEVLHQAQELYISQTDIDRGYLELPAASRFALTTNCPYHIEVHASGEWFRSVRVGGLAHDLEVSANDRRAAPGPVSLTTVHGILSYRFEFNSKAKPGTYAWPIRLFVQPG
ncbi:MAG: hypothetical protein ACREVG_14085 [Burkholderiales bacterium]